MPGDGRVAGLLPDLRLGAGQFLLEGEEVRVRLERRVGLGDGEELPQPGADRALGIRLRSHRVRVHAPGPRIGDPLDPYTLMGPLVTAEAVAQMEASIASAVADGGTVLCGGRRRPDLGPQFVEPTIIETTNPKFKTMVEEIFGPILTVWVYEDEKLDEALKFCPTVEHCVVYKRTGSECHMESGRDHWWQIWVRDDRFFRARPGDRGSGQHDSGKRLARRLDDLEAVHVRAQG